MIFKLAPFVSPMTRKNLGPKYERANVHSSTMWLFLLLGFQIIRLHLFEFNVVFLHGLLKHERKCGVTNVASF